MTLSKKIIMRITKLEHKIYSSMCFVIMNIDVYILYKIMFKFLFLTVQCHRLLLMLRLFQLSNDTIAESQIKIILLIMYHTIILYCNFCQKNKYYK